MYLIMWLQERDILYGVYMLLAFFFSCDQVADQLGAPKDPQNTTEVIFEVPKGTTARGLGTLLEKSGVIENADNFTYYVKLTKEGGCIKAGKFPLNAAMDAKSILQRLCEVPLANDKPFTILEGWRIREIDAALAKEGWITSGEYSKLATDPTQFSAPYPLPNSGTLEGYLYPETYMLNPDKFTAKGFIQRQLNMLDEVFYAPNKKEIEASKRSWNEIVIMASMLEREEPKPKQRPMVAGILWKRIDNKWNLGVDATSRYTLEEWNNRKAFLKKLRDPKDPYNTRLKGGLPPTAIGNPSVPSLEASLNPTDSPYWYYLHDASKTLRPSKNEREHEALRKKYNVY
jgi:UPF0755 protein